MTSKNLAENIAKSSVVIYNLILLKSMFNKGWETKIFDAIDAVFLLNLPYF